MSPPFPRSRALRMSPKLEDQVDDLRHDLGGLTDDFYAQQRGRRRALRVALATAGFAACCALQFALTYGAFVLALR